MAETLSSHHRPGPISVSGSNTNGGEKRQHDEKKNFEMKKL